MIYELFDSKNWHVGTSDSMKDARAKAMRKFKGQPIYIYRLGQRDYTIPTDHIPKLFTPIGVVTKNRDGFYYFNYEKRIPQFLNSDGTMKAYR